MQGWDHNSDERDDVIEWIFEQKHCDVATAAGYFFVAALGLAEEEPSALSSGYRRKWRLMKRIADNWNRNLYLGNEFALEVDAGDVKWYDARAARREAEGRPFPWRVPAPGERHFGTRSPQSAFCYEPGHHRLTFDAWKRQREMFGACGRDFPRCCGM